MAEAFGRKICVMHLCSLVTLLGLAAGLGSAVACERHQISIAAADETALATADALGFEMAGVEIVDGSDRARVHSVTCLKVPDGVDTLAALRTLQIALPGYLVVLN